MTFSKNNRFVVEKRNKIEQLLTKLREKNAKWYTIPQCSYCKLQKEELANIDSRLLVFIEENTSNIHKGITGFPSLYIPAQLEQKEIIIPGYRNVDNLFKLVSQL
jgi:hypothetical protein